LHVENFRSYGQIDTDLRALNVVLGKNASGKSSFIDVLRFLRDISRNGLDNAVSMQGGTRFLRNMCVHESEPLRIQVSLHDKYFVPLRPTKEGRKRVDRSLQGDVVTYDFQIRLNQKGDGYRVLDDELALQCQMYTERTVEGQRVERPEPDTAGRMVVHLTGRRLSAEFLAESGESPLLPEDLLDYEARAYGAPGVKRPLLLELPYLPFMFSEGVDWRMGDIAVYDFDPKLPKRAVPVTGRRQLEEDGSNLAIVLQTILKDRVAHHRFLNLVKYLLPFVVDMDVERIAGRSFLLRLRESFVEQADIPATFLSDGTIAVLALVVAIAFERPPIIVLEEPERNVHPSLMSRILGLVREAAADKQILLTTHNPEVVKHVSISDVLLATRGPDGLSHIRRPVDDKDAGLLLENEIGLDEVFVNDLWSQS
jgi:predicted ATPase